MQQMEDEMTDYQTLTTKLAECQAIVRLVRAVD